MSRFHDIRDEPELLARFEFPGEEIVGFYDNGGQIEPNAIVVTSRGLRFPGAPRLPALDYSDIDGIGLPRDKVNGPFELAIRMKSGDVRILPIAGIYGEGKDVYEFGRFLVRVTSDRILEDG